jgi:(2Fe-2S) ferredoxin
MPVSEEDRTDVQGVFDKPEDAHWYRQGRAAMLEDVVRFVTSNLNGGRLTARQILQALGQNPDEAHWAQVFQELEA